MANIHGTLVSLFDDIADAIREKDGTSAEIIADNFPSRIRALSGGGLSVKSSSSGIELLEQIIGGNVSITLPLISSYYGNAAELDITVGGVASVALPQINCEYGSAASITSVIGGTASPTLPIINSYYGGIENNVA